MSKTITFGLSVSEIDKAIKQVEQYKKDLNRKVDMLVKVLVAKGEQYTKESIVGMDAIYTGELLNSITGVYDVTNHVGAIYTDCAWSKFVFFGTGVVGECTPSEYANKFGWKYDVNEHGDKGWYYFKDGEWHWTKGMPSRNFFGDAIIQLRAELQTTAKEVFNS